MPEQTQIPPRTSKGPSGLEDTLEKIKQEFIKKLTNRGKEPSRDPKETERLLREFYRPGKSPSGLIAQTRQKILIVKSDDVKKIKLQNKDSIDVRYPGSILPLKAHVKRLSEYPNAVSEFKVPTKTILIEWETGLIEGKKEPDFISGVVSITKNSITIPILDQADQADNFIINPVRPNSEPDPPIRSLALGSALLELPVAKSDYSTDVYAIIGSELPDYPADTIKVVVSDTGLKLKINTSCGQHNKLPDQVYNTWNGKKTYFPIAPNSTALNPIGFCSLTNYLDDTYPSPPRDASFPTGIPTDDGKVLRNPNDDHHGRHGTCISAIVAQNPAGASAIIPLKIFDFLGLGTLFDILCGFNYIFSRIEAGENIRIVNASWGAAVPGDNFAVYALLEKKIAVLQAKNVFVLAAAGNRDNVSQAIGHSLSTHPAVPACYSARFDNVITVTTIAEKWEKVWFNRRNRSSYINQALHDKLLTASNPLEWLRNQFSNIVSNGYVAVENYSPAYVGVGVVAHPVAGIFPSPFGTYQPPIAGSSFATAFMSAYVVSFLKTHPGATRAEILASLPTHPSLEGEVDQGTYLELSTVTGSSIEANFEPVLHAILSTIT